MRIRTEPQTAPAASPPRSGVEGFYPERNPETGGGRVASPEAVDFSHLSSIQIGVLMSRIGSDDPQTTAALRRALEVAKAREAAAAERAAIRHRAPSRP